MSGKGSAPRPFSVSQEEYDSRWDAIFGRDQPKEVEPEQDDDWVQCPICKTDLVLSQNARHLYCPECGYQERAKKEAE